MRIFLRSFLSFWIATILIALISVGMVVMTHSRRRMPSITLPLPELRACAETSLQELSKGTSTQASVRSAANRCGVLHILDPSKVDLFAADIPEEVRSLSLEVSPAFPLSFRPYLNKTMVAFDVPCNGVHFVAVSIVPGRLNGLPPFLWWQFLVAATVSTLTSLIFARYLVDPIRKLRLCTELFGRGDLSSRPDALLLKRKDELGDLSNAIGQMSARISTLLSSQKNFLIQVSHELGSPLTRLNVALALARRKSPPALTPELDRIQCESSELNSMVQQLLRLARLESGLDVDEQEAYSLRQLMQEVCTDSQFIANEAGKHVHLLSSSQITMRGYRELLKRALDNVLRNAIRFTPEGSCVDVDILTRPGDMIVIQVKDRGVGVPDDKLGAIFEPFVRVSSTTDRSGAGLGLAIAKQAVHANGGTIAAMNLEQGGLLIEISLPFESSGNLTTLPGAASGQNLSAQTLSAPG